MGNKFNKLKFQFAHAVSRSGQMALMGKMRKYLALKDKSGESEKILYDIGWCFGFALINQVMKRLGKVAIRRWRAALVQIAHWDEREESLQNITLLFPGYPEPVSLDKAFEYAINYLFPNQSPEQLVTGASQQNLLDPGSRHFDIYFSRESKEAESKEAYTPIQCIQNHQVLTGHFSKAVFTQLVNESDASDNLCLISSGYHSLSLSYDPELLTWDVYDSNYSHDTVEAMERLFTTKEAAVDELINRMSVFPLNWVSHFKHSGISGTIQIASWKATPLTDNSVYEELLSHSPLSLAKQGGLDLIAYDRPSLLPRLFSHPDFESKEGAEIICHTLKHDNNLGVLLVTTKNLLSCFVASGAFKNASVKQAFAVSLKKQFSAKLFDIVAHNVETFLELVRLDIFKEKPLKKMLDHLLVTANKTQYFPFLHYLVYSSSNNVLTWSALLNHAFFQPYIPLLFTLKNKNGETPIAMIDARMHRMPELRNCLDNAVSERRASHPEDKRFNFFTQEATQSVASETKPAPGCLGFRKNN